MCWSECSVSMKIIVSGTFLSHSVKQVFAHSCFVLSTDAFSFCILMWRRPERNNFSLWKGWWLHVGPVIMTTIIQVQTKHDLDERDSGCGQNINVGKRHILDWNCGSPIGNSWVWFNPCNLPIWGFSVMEFSELHIQYWCPQILIVLNRMPLQLAQPLRGTFNVTVRQRRTIWCSGMKMGSAENYWWDTTQEGTPKVRI